MKIIRSLGAMALAGAAVTTTASAEERGYSAALCGSSSSNVSFSNLGVEVTNLSPGNVYCGAAPLVGADVDRIQATVYDRNPTSDVCCTMSVVNADGFTVASANRCSTGSGNASQLLSALLPVNVAGSVILSCLLPPASPSGSSRIATYRVRSTP